MIKIFDIDWFIVTTIIACLVAYYTLGTMMYKSMPKASVLKTALINFTIIALVVLNAWVAVFVLNTMQIYIAIIIATIFTLTVIMVIYQIMYYHTTSPKKLLCLYFVFTWIIVINLSHLINYIYEKPNEQYNVPVNSVSSKML